MPEVIEKQYTARKVATRQDELLTLAREALLASPADQTQVRIAVADNALTRFANSEIHQNTFERNALATVTALVEVQGGLAQGRATTNILTKQALAEAALAAAEAARHSPASPDLAEFSQGPFEYPFQVDYFESTAACTPEERAKKVASGFKVNQDKLPFVAAGTLSTNQINFAVANSRGVEAAYNTTQARYTVQWTGADSSGYREGNSRNVSDIDFEDLAVKALADARRSAAPRTDIEPGRYTVVLAPECMATMLGFLSSYGFSGRSYLDGASFMYGHLGEAITGPNITILDDPMHSDTQALPCDSAGTPRQRVMLIENGVARGVVHDANTAMRAGASGSTGHDWGGNMPMPQNLVMAGGAGTRDEIIGGVERGIYVTRFHYTNRVDPATTTITGMTRDGTFLIENGEITAGLTNFRFTQSILEAFARVTALAAPLVYQGSMWGAGCVVPEAVRIEGFNFSGKTSF
jgi:predicted Zn-dependent protease